MMTTELMGLLIRENSKLPLLTENKLAKNRIKLGVLYGWICARNLIAAVVLHVIAQDTLRVTSS